LAHLPIRELKIDRSFMRDVDSDPAARAIVTTMVRVGQSLQLTVVAEGVESEGQRNLLAELGCDVVQGFLYAPALSPTGFGRWLLDHSARRADAEKHPPVLVPAAGRVFTSRLHRRATWLALSVFFRGRRIGEAQQWWHEPCMG
jgi:predicted signal transduction protein with EAL and GGDEF domain